MGPEPVDQGSACAASRPRSGDQLSHRPFTDGSLETVKGFAGVVVLRADLVVLVHEPDYFSGEPGWTMPSGHVEDGEAPALAAARELAEESGCVLDPSDLELFAVAEVQHQGATISTSWNFTAATTEARLGPVVPDMLVTDARWFGRADAIDLIAQTSYAPKREPILRFLRSGQHGEVP